MVWLPRMALLKNAAVEVLCMLLYIFQLGHPIKGVIYEYLTFNLPFNTGCTTWTMPGVNKWDKV